MTAAGPGAPSPPIEESTTESLAVPLVALVGPPNSGKTTLYNQLTGLRQKVANYPGVTVEKHLGRVVVPGGGDVEIVDLPGVNGFSARTLDEKVTREVLEGRAEGIRAPDALILVVDSTRLEPQLMLVEPVLEIGVPTLLVLNMADELAAREGEVDDEALADQLGVTVVRANARAGEGLGEVREFLEHVSERGPLPPRPCPVISNVVSSGGVSLPVVDAFAARRKHIREVGQAAGSRPALESTSYPALDNHFLNRDWGAL